MVEIHSLGSYCPVQTEKVASFPSVLLWMSYLKCEEPDGPREYKDMPKDIPQWRKLPVSIPVGLRSINVTTVNNFMFVAETQTGACHLFDPRNYTWSKLATVMCQAEVLQDFTLVARGSNVFAVGGVLGNDFTNVILKYSFFFDSWSELDSRLPEKARDVGVSQGVYSKCYIAGGNRIESKSATWNPDHYIRQNQTDVLSDMFCVLKPATGKMRILPSLPQKVASAHILWTGSSVYVLSKEIYNSPKVMEFNSETEQWSILEDHRYCKLAEVFPHGDHIICRDLFGNSSYDYICIGENDPRILKKYFHYSEYATTSEQEGIEKPKLLTPREYSDCHWMYHKTLLPELCRNLHVRRPCHIRVPVPTEKERSTLKYEYMMSYNES